jgi:hypothetical protein
VSHRLQPGVVLVLSRPRGVVMTARTETCAARPDDVHRRVEELAAALLDSADDHQPDPESATAWHRSSARLATAVVGIAAREGRATLRSMPYGPRNALAIAATTEMVLSPDREPIAWCEHRPDRLRSTDDVTVNVALRYAGCPSCVQAFSALFADVLTADNCCDLCGVLADELTPVMVPYGPAVVGAFMCDESVALIRYDSPGAASTELHRVGRNDPCPCGIGRKAKRCHGAGRVDLVVAEVQS